MNWRPDDWINPYLQQDETGDFVNSRVFEAGADAMLGAIKKDAQYLNNDGSAPYGMVLARSLKRGDRGWLVFIPDKNRGLK